ncbi:CehA/McbA family metallohydrolase [Phenylobacterium sp.]|uniref:CehA/McbA family metallohydrolase n=1 Tax=Phenylobacterium sp. TaxID=1871053 RepID=UPI0037C875DD
MQRIFATLLAIAAVWAAAIPAAAETLTLSGVLTGTDHQTYREVPFRVAAGTTAVTVTFAYTGQDQKAVIDLGIRDPQRFRGWSGGNKASFTLTETWATPSYLPGPLPPGEWKLILGVPNLRKDARAEYKATITLTKDGAFHGFTAAPLKEGSAWYRGDLHLHTGHSDGSCPAQSGGRAPCPLFRTLDAAAARGLDFVAVTEHNTSSHFQALAELQPHYDRLLLIPGREITTFQGHANIIGMTAPLDFQLGGSRAPTFAQILDQAEAARALVTINHPGLPSGEACMGCGWTAPVDFRRIQAVEAINGGITDGPLSGVAFWEARLNAGFRLTAVGGSDNHDATLDPAKPSAVGRPTTVVYAQALSQDAILAGLRAGRVFIDVQGTRDRLLDTTYAAGKLTVRVAHAAGGTLVLKGPAAPLQALAGVLGEDETRTVDIPASQTGWVRAEVRGPDGALWLFGNPVYLTGS